MATYRRGMDFFNSQMYDSAVIYLGRFVKTVPRYKDFHETIINAYYKLAESYGKLGLYDNELLVYKELYKYIGKTYGYESREMAEFYKVVSDAYRRKGLMDKADEYRRLYEKLCQKFSC